jgi:hypothetical protein
MSKGIYRAHHAVPELGIRPGDTVIVDPAHSDYPLKVVTLHRHPMPPTVLAHLDAFTLLEARESEHDPVATVSFQRKQHRHFIHLVR